MTFSVDVIIWFLPVKRNFRTGMKIARVNFWSEFCIVSLGDENFYLR